MLVNRGVLRVNVTSLVFDSLTNHDVTYRTYSSSDEKSRNASP